MQTRTRLFAVLSSLRTFLVREHEGVPAAVAVVDGEGVAGEHAGQPGRALGLLGRQHALGRGAAAVLGVRGRDRALVAVVFARPVLAPLGCVGGVLGDLDETQVGVLGLLLALEDVHQKSGDDRGRAGDHDHDDGEQQGAGAPRLRGLRFGARWIGCHVLT